MSEPVGRDPLFDARAAVAALTVLSVIMLGGGNITVGVLLAAIAVAVAIRTRQR